MVRWRFLQRFCGDDELLRDLGDAVRREINNDAAFPEGGVDEPYERVERHRRRGEIGIRSSTP